MNNLYIYIVTKIKFYKQLFYIKTERMTQIQKLIEYFIQSNMKATHCSKI